MPLLHCPHRAGRVMAMLLMLMLVPSLAFAQAQQPPEHRHLDKTYKGREIADVMSYLGADWLLRPTRVREEQPERMLKALNVQPGDVVADVGAGVGYHSLMLSRMVGPEGLVYATDVQPEMLRMLRQRAQRAGAKNVKPVLVTHTDTGLPQGEIDLILMVDVYHEVAEPEATLKGLRAALKPGGRMVLVEFRAEDPDVPIKPEHKMTLEQVRKEIEPQGFAFKEVLDFLPWQHIIIFEKPVDADGQDSGTPDATDDAPPASDLDT